MMTIHDGIDTAQQRIEGIEDQESADQESTVVILGHSHLCDVLLKEYLENHSGMKVVIVQGGGECHANLAALGERGQNVVQLVNVCGKTWEELAPFLESRLTKLKPSAKVVLFNVDLASDIQTKALHWGVRGLITSSTPPEMVVKAIQCVAGGQIWASRSELEKCILKTSGVSDLQSLSHVAKDLLSKREVKVLSLVIAGHTNRAIAQKLFISENTVKTHVSSVFRKIGVSNRLQATLWVSNKVGESRM